MSHTPTPQQQAVYDAVADGTEHILVEALAGSGKSTTAIEAAKRAPAGSRNAFLAFNKHIAGELQDRLGGAARACTLHSLGFAAVRRLHRDIELDESKPKRLLQGIRPGWFYETARGQRPDQSAAAVLELSRLAKYTLADAQQAGHLDRLVERYDVDVPADRQDVYAAVNDLLTEELRDTGSCDFDDMIWLPVQAGARIGSFDLLLVDEAQDLNRCQQALAQLACPDGRIVPVGDAQQSLYAFAGADALSIPRLAERLRATARGLVNRPLTVTFRCPTAHVELARRLVPELEAAPGAIEGTVEVLPEKSIRAGLSPADMVICRTNAPLVDLAYRMVLAGQPVIMRGREIGRGLTELIERLRPDDPEDLGRKLASWHQKEHDRLCRRDAAESAFQGLADRYGCLSQLASQAESIPSLLDFINRLFSDQSAAGKTVLSSVHRAKGLEADRVVILEAKRLPLVWKDQRPEERQQELNVLYVAITRAKRELVFAGEMPAFLDNSPLLAASGGAAP